MSVLPAAAGPVSALSGFEDDDGNLAPNPAGLNFDWNSFSPTTWVGTAPTRTSSKIVSGWQFVGLEDSQATTADSAFAGGTKQDDNCGSVITAKAPNKDDLKRAYVSSKTVNGSVFLNLAWVRIPQNTTSPSAHIGFEFNQSQTACPAGSDDLVQRSAGDMLIVYDFEGGSTDVPTITLRRWLPVNSVDACEVGSNHPPCWGVATNLSALGFAEAKVNTTGSVSDTISPTSPASETLGTNEFGEAGINLSAAGVFQPGVCTGFGNVFAVSRSSGNSATAQMKDLVGPGAISITNCGTVIIHKTTVPSGDTTTNFGYTVTGPDVTPFSLKDGGTKTFTNVHTGAGSVTETSPASSSGYVFTSLNCSASEVDGGTQVSTTAATVNYTLAAGDTVECTYTNTLQKGAIRISKSSTKTANPLAGAQFSVVGVAPISFSTTVTTGADGKACVDGLLFGSYTVTETQAPTGYVIDDATGHTVVVDNNATCSDSPYVGEGIAFSDTPKADIQVRFRDGGSGETHLVGTGISCNNVTGTSSNADTTGWDDTLTVTGIQVAGQITITCTIVIDP
jgi:hypothetical protein